MLRWHRTVLLLAFLPAVASAGIAVSPIKIEKSITPENRTFAFVVANPSASAVEITLSTAPLVHDLHGKPVEAKHPYAFDGSKLIHLQTTRFTLPARRWRRIHARVDIPSRPGGGYAYVYVRAVDPTAGAHGVGAALRVGVVVELTFPDEGKQGLKVEGITDEDGTLRVAVRNEGDLHVRPAGTLVLKDAEGKAVWSAPIVPANIFPELVRDLEVARLPARIPSGQYTAKVELTSPVPASLTQEVTVHDGRLKVPGALASASPR